MLLDPSATLGDTSGASFEWIAADGESLGETSGAALSVDLKAGIHRLTLKVTDQNGKISTAQKTVLVQTPASLLSETFDDGDADGWAVAGTTSDLGGYLVKGSIFGNPTGEGEAALYQQADAGEDILLWQGAGSSGWSDYTFDMTVEPADNDVIGAVVYYTDADNYYALRLDQQNDLRSLTRVKNGTATVLASETASYRHFAPQDLRVAVLGDQITITLDDVLLFGGPVSDGDPLAGGTVGVLSAAMDRVAFDNIMVNPITLAARALPQAPQDRWAVDLDGNGSETIALTAAASLSAAGLSSIDWLIGSTVIASGSTAALTLPAGETTVTLRLTDATGAQSVDQLTLQVAANSSVLLADAFDDGNFDGWSIIDEGPLEGPSDWQVVNGALVQASNITSTQQDVGGGISRSAFSVEGDGPNILRDGTYALWNDPAALAWSDYVFEATLTPNDDDGIGLLFRYTDAQNYYKLESDAQTGLIMLTRHLDGARPFSLAAISPIPLVRHSIGASKPAAACSRPISTASRSLAPPSTIARCLLARSVFTAGRPKIWFSMMWWCSA